MIERGKFRSLTLINWNGFFARTFELDELVTTLSGGNGAGKSTTMAAFVTALIPDLTLLHFRNTTEAGATSGSRDKGLHGKLRPGVCYAILDVINSRHQRVLCGVRLQQVAGRDRKVDIKPFVIQGLPTSHYPTEVVTEIVSDRQARVLSLPELKEKLEHIDGVQFKQFSAITDYHAMMFDLGVLAKRLRSSSDRSKFYKLIEASLYGGISSAITRSLRDYLLPENGGVRKAFQDMEAALRENRMTLEAIRVTQSDRDLFKHLITESTNYVASDYMRNMNERRGHIENVLALRKSLYEQRKQLHDLQQQHIAMSQELQEHQLGQSDLDTDFQAASDHLNLVQTAVRQQEKIERYRTDIEELSERLAEQKEVVEDLTEQVSELEAKTFATEEEVDEIKSQLADYQQALGVQQTRAIQYNQALQSLDKARDLCQLPNLTVENAEEWLEIYESKSQESTSQLLGLEQKVSVAEAAISQFEQAYDCVCRIAGAVSRGEAWQTAKEILRDWPSQQYQAAHYVTLQGELSDLEQRLYEQQEAQRALDQFSKRLGRPIAAEALEELQQELEAQLNALTDEANALNQQRMQLQQEREGIANEVQTQMRKAPAWHAAQDALLHLNEQTEQTMTSSQQVTEQMQAILEEERRLVVERDEMAQRKRQLDEQISRLSQPSGAEDGRLVALAEKFGGVLLSEIYDDVTIDDAPYFSALYGPSRHGIVVPQLSAIREQLQQLEDTPDDLYFIEGDPMSFDDSVCDVEEAEGAVLVKSGDRQWRYSRFPEVPLFGRAAREKQLELLNSERDQLMEQYAKVSFDIQKSQRLHQNFSQFIGLHVSVAFESNPESALQQLNARRGDVDRALSGLDDQEKQFKGQLLQVKELTGLINKLMPQLHLLLDDELEARVAELQEEQDFAQEAADFVRQHAKSVQELESIASVLQSDPEQNAQLQETYAQIQASQKLLKTQVFALTEVVQRRTHFSYSDSAGMLSESSELSDKLRQRLEVAERERQTAREQMKQKQKQSTEYHQTWVSLKSAFESKQEMLNELEQEMRLLGVRVDANTEARAQQRRNELQTVLTNNRERCHQLEKQLMLSDNEMEQLNKGSRRTERDYVQLRQQVVQSKAAWQRVIGLVKENGMVRRLHRRELGYMHADELRSRSDKALGALRLAVADNEHLRDALRASEDPKSPEKKILFYVAVYQHLRERIRQDIVQTDDPIEAIEQMEIELNRLTEELTSREQKLAISAKSVANIIRKTIQREQNRIQMLNQGLQAVSFGQVNSVRLNVNVRETHSMMLQVLADQHDAHQDLFTNHKLTFSEALAKLYQRMNPHIDFGQRTAQTIGEELLDYRNYLELEVEVNRGTDGWLRAESGALSTGEAIGTGMSILVMVVQSWEEESKRLRGKDISPCRLLFLDEAARLDAKSIATLFELCERLEMQLIIAAPENISPEKGTTYKLVRKVFQNKEHVHVVGLKGFAQSDNAAAILTDNAAEQQIEQQDASI